MKAFNLSGLFLAVLASVVSPTAIATNPAGGTLSPTSGPLTFTSGPHAVSNPSASAQDGGVCVEPSQPCDHFNLALDIPAEFALTHPSASVQVRVGWPGATDDYDIYTLDASNSIIAQSAGSSNPEVMSFAAGCGPRTLRVRILPFAVSGTTASGTVTLIPGDEKPLPPGPIECSTNSGPPPPPPPSPGGPYVPRYRAYSPPQALDGNTGEPSIGYNLETRQTFLLSGLKTLWITFPQDQNPPLPQACEGAWEERSFATTQQISLDPIGLTDSLTPGKASNRTYVGQLSAKSHLMAYTDDDGENWTPTQGSSTGASGVDHQTIGVGPYPEGMENLAVDPNFPNAFYYCAQDIAYANCARSDNGGLTFGPPINMYNLTECPGLHGHLRAAPDGTIYVPNSGCGGKPSVVVSEDAGLTWDVRPVPGATEPSGRDPQMALASDGSGYLCFAAGNNKAFAAVTRDKGLTWSEPKELGTEFNLQHTTFLQGIAGDPDRAACGFVGTTTAGNPTSMDFKGIWHLYIATTYDGGQNWTTVNATPVDLVQGYGGIWDSGGGNTNRNLLDFNEMTIDERGFPLYGFTDGCLGVCEQDPSKNGFAAFPRLVRQLGGRPLYAAFDRVEPYAPPGACLSGTRTEEKSSLSWRAPENGGADIVNYKVYRGTTSGGETYLGETGSAKTTFEDLTADPNETVYYYTVTALNSAGEGVFSNEILLPISVLVSENSCAVPGITVLTDTAGDSTGGVAQTDVQKLSIAEPLDFEGKLVFSMKIGNLNPAPPNTYYFVLLKGVNGKDLFVSFDTQGGLQRFLYGEYTVGIQGVLTFNEQGNLPGSGINAQTGVITLIAPHSIFGITQVGDILSGIEVRVRQGGQSATSRDTTTTSDYTTRLVEICRPNTPPLAGLAADLLEGYPPLTVTFTVTGSDADSDPLAKYTLEFGDGDELENQSLSGQQLPVRLTHTYHNPRQYLARLTVTDSRGGVSTNAATQLIVVTGDAAASVEVVQNNRLGGGALPIVSLLLLGLLGALSLRGGLRGSAAN